MKIREEENDDFAYCKDNAPSMMILSLFYELSKKKNAFIIQIKMCHLLLVTAPAINFHSYNSISEITEIKCLSSLGNIAR